MIKFIQKKMNKKGFTLVELIIVIAVMAILAAIVVPRMSGITQSFKVKADERVCDTLAREIEVSIQAGNTPTDTHDDITTSTVASLASGEFYYWISGNEVIVYVNTAQITTPTLAMFAADGSGTHTHAYARRDSGGAIE